MNVSKDYKCNSFNLTITPNLDKQDRSAKIQIVCGEKKAELTIYQYGNMDFQYFKHDL